MNIQCPNPKCRADNPANAKFCRKCGSPISDNVEILVCEVENSNVEMDSLPFHLKHPEYHLRPISEYPELSFNIFQIKPEYVEQAEGTKYYFIARKGMLGILFWTWDKKHWWSKEGNVYQIIIPCKYDHIVKGDGYFKCHKDSQIDYFDLKGNRLK